MIDYFTTKNQVHIQRLEEDVARSTELLRKTNEHLLNLAKTVDVLSRRVLELEGPADVAL